MRYHWVGWSFCQLHVSVDVAPPIDVLRRHLRILFINFSADVKECLVDIIGN